MSRHLLSVVVAALMATGCGGVESPTSADLAAVASDVEREAESRSGVIDATVHWGGDGTVPGDTPSFAILLATDGLDDEARGEIGLDLVERIWDSELSQVLTVLVEFDNGPNEPRTELADVADVEQGALTRVELEELFGPRRS